MGTTRVGGVWGDCKVARHNKIWGVWECRDGATARSPAISNFQGVRGWGDCKVACNLKVSGGAGMGRLQGRLQSQIFGGCGAGDCKVAWHLKFLGKYGWGVGATARSPKQSTRGGEDMYLCLLYIVRERSWGVCWRRVPRGYNLAL